MSNKRHREGTAWLGNDGRIWEYEENCQRARLFWSKTMDEKLARLYPTTSNRELAKEFMMDRKTIEAHAQKLGLKKDKTAINARRSELLKKARPLMRSSKHGGRCIKEYTINETPEQKTARIAKMIETKRNYTDYQKAVRKFNLQKAWTPEKKEILRQKAFGIFKIQML